MPELLTWFVALLVGATAVLQVINMINLRRLRRDAAARERRNKETDRQVRVLLGQYEDEETPEERRRQFWLVPVFAGVVTAVSWLKHHPGPVLATAGSVAAVMLLAVAGTSSQTRRAEPGSPPAIVAPTGDQRTPSLTTALPMPGTASTTTPPASGTHTMPAQTTQAIAPPTVTTSSTTAPTVTITTTSQTPTSTETPATPCLLAVGLTPMLDLCVPAVH